MVTLEANRAVFGWLSKTKTKVITQANHRGCKKTVQPTGSQSNSRLVLRSVLLSNQQCEYTPSLAWEMFGFGFGSVPDWLRMLTNLCRPIRKRSKRKINHTITFDSHPKTALKQIKPKALKFRNLVRWRWPFARVRTKPPLSILGAKGKLQSVAKLVTHCKILEFSWWTSHHS